MMGMVMLVQVGDEQADAAAVPDTIPQAARDRFDQIIDRAMAADD